MKYRMYLNTFFLLLLLGASVQLFAQARLTRPTNPPPTTADDYFNTPTKRTTQPQQQQPQPQQQPQRATTSGNAPIEFVPSQGGNPLTDTIKRTLRSEDAIERNLIKERVPLEYEFLREDDAVYRQRVWRIIDVQEKMNMSFRNPAVDDGSSQLFIAILYKAITEDGITAFKDERFSEPYTIDEFKRIFTGGMDTVNVYDLDGNVVRRQARPREFMVDSILKYQVKEEWIFNKQTSRMTVRIIGIAPMMKVYTSDMKAISEDSYPLFWVYYPDTRASFAKYEVYNPKNFGAKMSWEELFENRYFSSRIVKSTLDNPMNQPLKGYITDPLFQLYEGEKIKNKIFDYEQTLWEY